MWGFVYIPICPRCNDLISPEESFRFEDSGKWEALVHESCYNAAHQIQFVAACGMAFCTSFIVSTVVLKIRETIVMDVNLVIIIVLACSGALVATYCVAVIFIQSCQPLRSL